MRKKKKKKQKLEWATAHLVVESRYSVLYRDRHGLGAPGGATRPRGLVGARSGMPRYGLPRATIRSVGLRHGRPTRKGERRACEGLAAGGVCCDTINCIVTGRRLSRWVVSRHRCDTAGGSTTIWCRELLYELDDTA